MKRRRIEDSPSKPQGVGTMCTIRIRLAAGPGGTGLNKTHCHDEGEEEQGRRGNDILHGEYYNIKLLVRYRTHNTSTWRIRIRQTCSPAFKL